MTASTWGPLAQGVITVPSADTRITNLRVGPAELPGIVVYQDGASLLADGVIINRVRTFGMGMRDRSRVDGRELVVSDTQAYDGGRFGERIVVRLAGVLDLQRAWISGNHHVGVFASDEGTSLSLSQAAVRDTQAQQSDGTRGRGVSVHAGATATVARTLLSRNREHGVFTDGDGTSLTLSDVAILDTWALESNAAAGRGLGVQRGATATVTRALLSRNRDVGAFAASLGTTVELLDVVVAETREQACAETTCADQPFGMGLVGTHEASLSASRFAVQDGALCGVMVTEDGQVDLAVGEVSGFPIGACLQVEGYSVQRLTDGVRYVDNDANLDTTSLPVPELASTIDAAR